MHEESGRLLAQPGVFDDQDARRELLAREAWAKGFEIAKLHADVFATDAGQKLLAHWLRAFYAFPIVRPGEDAFAQGIREGRADVVRQILVQIEIARQGPTGG